jgi:hypothetical protein
MVGVLDVFFATVLLAISTSFALLITMPFLGTLVRYRANYTPKGLQLDADGTVQPHVGPVVHGYWSMFMRTRRIEVCTHCSACYTLTLMTLGYSWFLQGNR